MALNVSVSDTVSVQNAVEVIAVDLSEDFTVRLRIASLISIDIDILHRYVNVAEVVFFRRFIMATNAEVVNSFRELSSLSILPHAVLIVSAHHRWNNVV